MSTFIGESSDTKITTILASFEKKTIEWFTVLKRKLLNGLQ
jgi:hypothetical protein